MNLAIAPFGYFHLIFLELTVSSVCSVYKISSIKKKLYTEDTEETDQK